MAESTVVIGMKELISLMAKEVAQQVADELRDKDIAPLTKRITDLEVLVARPNPDVSRTANSFEHMKGMFDGAWKLAVMIIAVIEAWHYLKH